MFIVLSTFTTISYLPIEKYVPQDAQKPHRRVLSLRWGCRRYCCGYMKSFYTISLLRVSLLTGLSF